jgi:hypothetical protein
MTATAVVCIAAAFVAACALVTALIALQVVRNWRARYESLESTVAGMRRELELVASISARTGRRVQRVEHDYSGVAERVDLVETRATTTTGTGAALDQAIDWARRGADSERIAQQFGLSSAEADLVLRLHGRTKNG